MDTKEMYYLGRPCQVHWQDQNESLITVRVGDVYHHDDEWRETEVVDAETKLIVKNSYLSENQVLIQELAEKKLSAARMKGREIISKAKQEREKIQNDIKALERQRQSVKEKHENSFGLLDKALSLINQDAKYYLLIKKSSFSPTFELHEGTDFLKLKKEDQEYENKYNLRSVVFQHSRRFDGKKTPRVGMFISRSDWDTRVDFQVFPCESMEEVRENFLREIPLDDVNVRGEHFHFCQKIGIQHWKLDQWFNEKEEEENKRKKDKKDQLLSELKALEG